MNHVIRRNWLSALVLASMTVFAGCAAETGAPEESAAVDTPKDGDGEAVGTAKQEDISELNLLPGEHCDTPGSVQLERSRAKGVYWPPVTVDCCMVFGGSHTTESCGEICFFQGRCVGYY